MSDSASARPEPTRPVPLEFKPDGSVEALTFLSPADFNIRGLIEVPPMRVIPVVFVPGIMGSNLRKKGRPKEKVWRPPNDGGQEAGAARAGAFTNATERQLAFIPDDAEVDPSGPVMLPSGVSWLSQRGAQALRGWGTVHMGSYGELLGYLEYQLNRVFVDKNPNPEWAAVLKQQDAQRWGAQKAAAFDVLTTEELAKLPRARYPVYAAGYNWLQSNEKSAQHLAQRIAEILAKWSPPHRCTQVLLVTHSMGGLVARRCSQLIPEKILGIVHGVMPALGAAAAYKRMRAGFEGAAAVVLGWNEAEATASVANAPGPLELLPQPGYNGGEPWLQLTARDKSSGETYATQWLPQKSPYAEIYEKDAKTCWYGLVNSDLIDPARLHINMGKTPWSVYMENLRAAGRFHTKLGNHYHLPTRAYYGDDPSQTTWGNACWRTHDLSRGTTVDMTSGTFHNSTGTGTIGVAIGKSLASFKIERPDASGDGTVPARASGRAPADSPNVQQCYCMKGFEHQFSYNDPQARLMLLHSLAKLAQQSSLVGNLPFKHTTTSKQS